MAQCIEQGLNRRVGPTRLRLQVAGLVKYAAEVVACTTGKMVLGVFRHDDHELVSQRDVAPFGEIPIKLYLQARARDDSRDEINEEPAAELPYEDSHAEDELHDENDLDADDADEEYEDDESDDEANESDSYEDIEYDTDDDAVEGEVDGDIENELDPVDYEDIELELPETENKDRNSGTM